MPAKTASRGAGSLLQSSRLPLVPREDSSVGNVGRSSNFAQSGVRSWHLGSGDVLAHVRVVSLDSSPL